MSSNSWPNTRRQQILWLQQRIDDWITNAAAIGLNPTQVATLGAMLGDAGDKLEEAITARSIAKGKTTTFHNAAEPVSIMAGGFVKTIRAFAATSSNPNVYELARLDAPATPTPAPPPTVPTDIRTIVENDGSITIRWKAKNAAPGAGTAFTLFRKLAGQEGYSALGTTGLRHFTDETVPPGTPSASYLIRGLRGGKIGDFSEPVTVYLGKAPLDGGDGLSLAA